MSVHNFKKIFFITLNMKRTSVGPLFMNDHIEFIHTDRNG